MKLLIVPITGKVNYPITLDASVWIFDDRRIKFEDAFSKEQPNPEKEEKKQYTSDERFNREVFQATNDNKPIPRKDADEILKSTFVMSFKPFYDSVEIQEDASEAVIIQDNGNEISIPLEKLKDSYFLFSEEGKPVQDGPVHIYFKDGSNKEDPIKAVKKIDIR